MTVKTLLVLLLIPLAAPAKDAEMTSQEYGTGLVCPRTDSQVSFYTENDQQDAAGTLGYVPGTGYTVMSDSVKSLEAGKAHLVEGLCEGGAPAIRIDARRDGWLQAGIIWLPPNLEWDYADWQEYLHKAAIWKPLAPLVLFQGSADEPFKDKPYAESPPGGKIEIYPLKFVDNYALVLLDKTGAYGKSCAGTPTPPEGQMGWLRLSTDNGAPVAVPSHLKGC